MGGPNLEVFKFGLYLFVPVLALLHFGDPSWYRNHVLPYKDHLFPADDRTYKHIPVDQAAIRDELARIKTDKLARRLEREQGTVTGSDRAESSKGWFKWW
ncbi:hypothetical protein BJ138DRAFT_996597 [Hygrophoropsis aurantiaca]|uniref:Uncharacterized protein n=1 Tax=Hygrophoropsis aurantiaca TaxID=72124 RepID=A0ACB8AQX4_9AGAM|nr:hypothetical protein BJ138DRAFT_996597 [Hygrophoropsis aurantiaca]